MRQRQFAQPGELALGELAGGGNAFFGEIGIIARAGQIIPSLAVADAAHRWHVGRQVATRAQGGHFIDQAAGQHVTKALGDAAMQAPFSLATGGLAAPNPKGNYLFVDGTLEVEIAPGVKVKVLRHTVAQVMSKTEPASA